MRRSFLFEGTKHAKSKLNNSINNFKKHITQANFSEPKIV